MTGLTFPTQLFKYCFVVLINMKVRPEDSLKIENIVASAKVCDYLDLPMLASKIKDAEYNKKRFPGVVLRMQNPKIWFRQSRSHGCKERGQPDEGIKHSWGDAPQF